MLQTAAIDRSLGARAADALVVALEARIVSGELADGAPLPPERDLIENFGVSRTVVREAVAALASRGLVQVRARHRPIVRRPGYDAALAAASGVVEHLLTQAGGVKHLYDTRIFLEAALVRHAALHARKQDIEALKQALDANEAAIRDSERFYATDVGFHAVLYEVPGNPVLPAIHNAFTTWLAPHWVKMPRSPERNRVNFLRHADIHQAIRDRDPEVAEAALKAHLNAAWEFVRGTFDAPLSQRKEPPVAHEEFDHIVVGGGSAGCVCAGRLVEGGHRVLLLEGGHSNRHPLLDMPPGIFKMINGSKFMQYHTTEPQAHLGGRAHDIPQGNVLGGGSSVNAQVYMRGRPGDYDAWNEVLRGNNDGADWSWDAVLPHFRGMEDNERFNDGRHGVGGPLQVSDPGHIDQMSRWFVQAMQGLGVPFNPDFNGSSQRGVGFYQFTNRRGKRASAAHAFIEPLKDDPRLTVRLQARVERILIENGRAVGVVWRDRRGQEHRAHAKGEVVVAAGALITPKLLMLSGIGPADHLREHGIAVAAELPGVGQNLIDHPEVPIISTVSGPYGYFRQAEGWRMLWNALQFKVFGTGRILSAGVEAGAFVNPRDREGDPTIQAFCVPIVYLDRDALGLVENTYGLTVTTVVVKPRSRGWVKLRSADPSDRPRVSPNLLGDPEDMTAMIDGQRFFLRAFHTEPLASRVKRIAAPDPDRLDDATLAEHCKRFVKTNYHPASTARMGADGDPMAVLDARMRVRGIAGLRVADMSAVPDISAGNTNAPAMMLGDRCALFIMGRA